MASAATRAAADAGPVCGGTKVNRTVEVPLGTRTCWNSPGGPAAACSTGTPRPSTVAVHPGTYCT
jgi:hypothetical protein